MRNSAMRTSYITARTMLPFVPMKNSLRIAILVTLYASLITALAAEDWPEFRGPTRQGISSAKGLVTEWSPTENIVWKADVGGVGWGSPVVWGDHIFLTSAINTERDDRPALKVYTPGLK